MIHHDTLVDGKEVDRRVRVRELIVQEQCCGLDSIWPVLRIQLKELRPIGRHKWRRDYCCTFRNEASVDNKVRGGPQQGETKRTL